MVWRTLLVIALCSAAHAERIVPPPADDTPPTKRLLSNIPDALKTAKPWIGRRYMTGMLPDKTPNETFTLQHDGKQALLTHEVKVPSRWSAGKLDGDILAWRTESVTQYLGTIEEKGNVVKLSFANGADKLDWTCKKTKVAAARADAVRIRSPRYSECGDKGRWSPATTKQVSVIRCAPFDEPKPNDPDAVEEWEKLAFAPGPGIEWLHVNDDCVIQGGGWRMVPADGSIARPKPKAAPRPPGKAASAKPD